MRYKLLFSSLFIFISLTAFNQTTPASDTSHKEDPDIIFMKTEIAASFPGGDAAWQKYLAQQMRKHIDEIVEDGRSGTCIVKFTVDKDGTVSDVIATTMKGTKLADVAVNAIKKGPKWMPAQQHGHNVKAFREEPVTFTMQEQ